jgi:futalosine hydrolase
MSYLIVAATALEIAPFITALRTRQGQSRRVQDTDILVTGPGLTAATWSLTRQVHLKKPQLIIQAGLGGCFDENLPLGTVVAIRQETIADQSVMQNGSLHTLFDLGLASANQFPYRNGWLINTTDPIRNTRLKKVRAVSVNEITTSKKTIRAYIEKFNPVIESMEGAAVHYVALMEKIPFLQLRAASNYVGERNKKKWAIEFSIEELNKVLVAMLK